MVCNLAHSRVYISLTDGLCIYIMCLFSITGSHIPFNFDMILNTKIWNPNSANDFKTRIDEWLKTMPKGKGIHSNWVV